MSDQIVTAAATDESTTSIIQAMYQLGSVLELETQLTGDQVKQLFQSEQEQLYQPDWIVGLYGIRAWLVVGPDYWFSAVVVDGGNDYYRLRAVFPTASPDIVALDEEAEIRKANDRRNYE